MIAQRSGTSRTNRLVTAIDPTNAPIDKRSITDLLNYVKEVANLIDYYNADGRQQGTWEQFFRKNETFFLATILHEETANYYKRGSRLLEDLHLMDKAETARTDEIFLNLLLIIYHFFQIVENWLEAAEEVSRKPLGTGIASEIKTAWEKIGQTKSLLEVIGISRAVFDLGTVCWEASPVQTKIGQPSKEASKVKAILNNYPTETTDLLKKLEQILEQHADLAIYETLHCEYELLKNILNTLFQHISYLQQSAKRQLTYTLQHKSNQEPLVGLLIAFLKIFQLQQDHLNGFAAKHLEYYYHQILQQKPKTAIPDHAYVSFVLNKETPAQFLPKGTRLLAGVNEEGLESHYETLHDVWVSSAKIKALQTMYVSLNKEIKFSTPEDKLVSNIYFAPMANSKDGRGRPFDAIHKSWPIVGEDQIVLSNRKKTMEEGALGLGITAPILYLEAGIRKITLQIKVENDSRKKLFALLKDMAKQMDKEVAVVDDILFRDAFEVYATTTEGWMLLKDSSLKLLDQDETTSSQAQVENGAVDAVTFTITLDQSIPPLVPLGDAVVGERFPTKWPIIKILLKSGTSMYAYSFFHFLQLEELAITVDVKRLTKLNIHNIAGDFNNSTPFPLFGAVPDKDSEFLIGSRELSLKNIKQLAINLEWNNLPDSVDGFEGHYKEYTTYQNKPLSIDNETFKVKISALSNGHFIPRNREDQQVLPLFNTPKDQKQLCDTTTWSDQLIIDKLNLLPQLEGALDLAPYTNDSQFGYIRLALHEPKFAFGHALYPHILSKAVTENAFAQADKAWWKFRKTAPVSLPQEPYHPMIKGVSIDYTAKSNIYLVGKGGGIAADAKESQIYHISPIGFNTIFEKGINTSTTRDLLEPFGSDGYLMIGLEDVEPGLPLNLMFDLAIFGKKALEEPVEILWFYLADNDYLPITQEDFYYDTTFKFTTSGVVSLRLPEDINRKNTIMPDTHYWLLIAARGRANKVLGSAIQVVAHAVETQWVDNGDESHYSDPASLPKIQELLVKKGSITAVQQVSSFFGGLPKESKELLWTRVSERLRHKGRAINLWDFERLVLQNFPSIRQVKCIGPDEEGMFLEAGQIKVVVVSEQMGKGNIYPTVGFHVLGKIKEYLSTVASPHLEANIVNPAYEWLKISLAISLKRPLRNQRGKYLAELYDDIENFICPWLLQGDIRIGSGFKKKDLVDFIKSRPYVDYVTRFSIVHVFEKAEQLGRQNKKATKDYQTDREEIVEVVHVFNKAESTNEDNQPKEEQATQSVIQQEVEVDLLDSANENNQRDTIQPSCAWGILVPAWAHKIEFVDSRDYKKPVEAAISQMILETDFVIVKEEKLE